MSSKTEEAQQLVHTITSYAEWTADEKNGLEFSFFMDGQTIPRYVDLNVKNNDNAVQDRLHLDLTDYAYEDNFKVYDLDKEALGHLLAIVADSRAQNLDPAKEEQEEPLLTLSRETYARIDRHPVGAAVSNDHLANVVNFMSTKRSALSSQGHSPYYCSCMVTNGNKFIAQASGDACAFFYFEKALYPLFRTPNLQLEDKDPDGNLLNSFYAYCDTDLGMAHSSKVIPVLENSVVILCNLQLFETLGQMDLIKIVHECSYTDNIAQALVAQAYDRHPERSFQAASLYFLSAAESETLKSRIRDLLRRPHESLGQTPPQDQVNHQKEAAPTDRNRPSYSGGTSSPRSGQRTEQTSGHQQAVGHQQGTGYQQARSTDRPAASSGRVGRDGRSELVPGSSGQPGGRSEQKSFTSGLGVPDKRGPDRRDPDRQPSPSLYRGPEPPMKRAQDYLPEQATELEAKQPSDPSLDRPSNRPSDRPLDLASDRSLDRPMDRASQRSLDRHHERSQKAPLEQAQEGPDARSDTIAPSRENGKNPSRSPRRLPPPPNRSLRPALDDIPSQKTSSLSGPPQGGGSLLESDKYEPKSPSDRTREFSRSPFESRDLGVGEETGGDPTKNIKDVLKSTRISPDIEQKTAEIVTDPSPAQPQEQGRAPYGIRRKGKNSSLTAMSDNQVSLHQKTPRSNPSTSTELSSDTLASKSSPKLVTFPVDHNAATTNGEMEKSMENTNSKGISMRAYPNPQTDTLTDRQNTVPCEGDPQLLVKVDLSFPLGEKGYDDYDMYHYEDGEVVTQTGTVILKAEDFVARQQALLGSRADMQGSPNNSVQAGSGAAYDERSAWPEENPGPEPIPPQGGDMADRPGNGQWTPRSVSGPRDYRDDPVNAPNWDQRPGNPGPGTNNGRRYKNDEYDHSSDYPNDYYGNYPDGNYPDDGDSYGPEPYPYPPNGPYEPKPDDSNRPIDGGGNRPRPRPSRQPAPSASFMANKTVRIAFYGIMATICIVCMIILVWLMKEKNQQDKDKNKRMSAETSPTIERTVETTQPTTVETTTEPTETETSEIETTTEDTEQTLAEPPYVYHAEAGDDVYSLCAQFYGSTDEKYAKVLREANPEVFANGDTPAPGASIIQPQMKSAPYYGKTQDEILAMPAPSKTEHEAGEEGTQETGPDGLPVAQNSEPDTSERQTLPVNP